MNKRLTLTLNSNISLFFVFSSSLRDDARYSALCIALDFNLGCDIRGEKTMNI
jgi:hypothetical protein